MGRVAPGAAIPTRNGGAMAEKILIVEGAHNPLGKTREALATRFDCTFAVGVEEGAQAAREGGPFAVIVADYKQPKKDGASFLARMRELHPKTVRLLLTVYAELDAGLAAQSDNLIFRFVMKPLSPDMLARHLEAALAQYRLENAEAAFVQDTLRGAVQALTEVLNLANPAAFGRSMRIRGLVQRLSKAADIPRLWEVDMAAMLSHVGCVSLPAAILDKLTRGRDLDPAERRLFESHPTLGAALLANIPRMESVAQIIGAQLKPLADNPPLGAQALRVALDYDLLANKGLTSGAIFSRMRGTRGIYATQLLDALESVIPPDEGYVRRRVNIRELKENMQLDEDIVSVDGMLLLAKGSELNETNIYRLIETKQSFDIVEPVAVLIPTHAA